MAITIDERNIPEEITEAEKKSILINIKTLASMPYGTAPLLRQAGVHMPENMTDYSRNKYATEIIENAENYEDRAEVSEVHIDNKGEVKVVVDYGNE